MSRNYAFNTGYGVGLFMASNQNVGFNTREPAERMNLEDGNAKFSSNVYVMKRVGVQTTTPSVELDVTGDAHVTGEITIDGSMKVYNPVGVNGFYVTKSGDSVLQTSLSSAVQNIDVSPTGTQFVLTNSNNSYRFTINADYSSNFYDIMKIPAFAKTELYRDLQVSGNILPGSNLLYDLGSDTQRWKDLYLSGNTINMAGTQLTIGNNGQLVIQNSISSDPVPIIMKELQLQDNVKVFNMRYDSNVNRLRLFSTSNSIETDESCIANLYTSNNLIGIGTSNPSAALHVTGDSIFKVAKIGSYPNDINIAMFAHSNLGGTTSYALLHSVSGETYLNASSTKAIRFRINNNEAAIISSAGRFGVGTTVPEELLQVQGKIYSTSQILGMSNDSSSLPAFSFKNDSNTGIFHPAAQSLGFATGGNERLRINSTGNIGIGTINPSSICHIYGSTPTLILQNADNSSNSIRFLHSNSTLISEIGINTQSNVFVSNKQNGSISFETNALSRMTITSNGNVGINTTTPSETLQVQGKIFTTNQLLGYTGDSSNTPGFSWTDDSNTGIYHPVADNIGVVTNGSERIRINNTGNVGINTTTPTETLQVNGKIYTTTQILSTSNDSSSLPSFSFKEDSNTGIFHPAAQSLGFTTSGNERLRINSTGNIGIGTINPSSICHIYGSTPTLILQNADNSSNSIRFLHSNSTLISEIGINTQSNIFIANKQNGSISFETNALARMTITSNGNVGINTTTPTFPLQVEGNSFSLAGRQTRVYALSFDNTTVDAVRNVFDVDIGHGGGFLEIVMTQSDLNALGGRIYHVPMYYNLTNNVWQIVRPLTSTNGFFYNGYDLQVLQTNSTMKLRVRRRVGITQGTLYLYVTGSFTKATTPTFTDRSSEAQITDSTTYNAFTPISHQFGGSVLIDRGTLNDSALTLSSSSAGWGSGMVFENTIAKKYGIYSGSDSNFYIYDVTNSRTSLTINNSNDIILPRNMNFNDNNSYIKFPNSAVNRKIILWETTSNDHQYYGMGINGSTYRFQVDATTSAFRYYAATSGTASTEVMSILGNGNVGINAITPSETLQANGKIYTTTQFLSTSNDSVSLPSYSFKEDSNTGMFHPATQSLGFATAGAERVRINNSGNVGIGTNNPSYRLHVIGDIYSSGDITGFSDSNYKTDLIPISDALNKLNKITGFTFKRKDTESSKRYTGLLAQEVQTILPEAVYSDLTNNLSIAYGNMAGIFVEAIKELKAENTRLSNKVNDLTSFLQSKFSDFVT